MRILCKLKKALNIKSPSPYEYCKLNLNAENKEKCKKCEYFKTSQYNAYVAGKRLNEGVQSAIECIKKLNEAMKSVEFVIPIKKGGNE